MTTKSRGRRTARGELRESRWPARRSCCCAATASCAPSGALPTLRTPAGQGPAARRAPGVPVATRAPSTPAPGDLAGAGRRCRGSITFAVRLDGGDVYVDRPRRRPPPENHADGRPGPRDERTFAVIGAAPPAPPPSRRCARTAFTGRIVLLCREERRPYRSPQPEQGLLAGKGSADWLPLRPVSFYERHEHPSWSIPA